MVGAGAVGILYAAQLAASTPGSVALLTRRDEARAHLRDGVRVTSAGRPPVVATPTIMGPDLAADAPFDLAILAVPAYDTASVASLVDGVLSGAGTCVSVQNGLDNAPILREVLGPERVVQGATSFAVHLAAPGHTSVDGVGATWLPPLAPGLTWFEQRLAVAGLNPQPVDDPERLAWTKTAIGVNGFICLVLNAPLGSTLGCQAARDLALRAAMEIVDVAESCGRPLDRRDIRRRLERSWGEMGPDARSSLYSGLAAGRRTEIDERLGAVLRRAATSSVDVPTLSALYELAKTRLHVGVAV